jgi:hypothetical protein
MVQGHDDLGHTYLSIRLFPDNVSAFDEFKGVEGSGKISIVHRHVLKRRGIQ